MRILRIIFVLILNFSLLNTQFYPQRILVISKAYADEDNSNSDKRVKDALSSASTISLITLVAIGGTMMGLSQSCDGLTTDMKIALAGAVIYVGAEVYSMVAYKDTDDKIKEFESELPEEEQNIQIQALEKQKAAYENNKGVAETKSMIQKAAAVAFAAAAGVALWKHFQLESAIGACEETIQTQLSAIPESAKNCMTLKGCPPGSVSPSCAEAIPRCQAAAQECQGAVGEAEAKVENLDTSEGGDSSCDKKEKVTESAQEVVEATEEGCTTDPAFQQAVTAITAACEPMKELVNEEVKACPGLCSRYASNDEPAIFNDRERKISSIESFLFGLPYTPRKKVSSCSRRKESLENFSRKHDEFIQKFISKNFELIFPSAQAVEASSIFGLGAVGLGLYMALKEKSGEMTDLWIATPLGRSVLFGAIAGLGYYASTTTDNVAKEMQERIDKINEILEQFRKKQDENRLKDSDNLSGTVVKVDPAPLELKNKPATRDSLSSGETRLPNDQRFPCATSSSTSCDSLGSSISGDISGIDGIPPDMAAAAISAGKTADGIQGSSGLSSGALANGSTLGGLKNAVNKDLDRIRDLVDKLRGDRGKGPLNHKKMSDDLAKDFLNATKAEMLKNPQGAADFMSSFGGPLGAGGDLSSGGFGNNAIDGKEGKEELDKLKFSSGAGLNGAGGSGLNFGNLGSGRNNGRYSLGNKKKLKGLVDKALKNQVHNDNSNSIWRLLTYRYQKTGYPIFFEEVVEEKPEKKVKKNQPLKKGKK